MSDVRECGNCEFWIKRTDRVGEMGGGYCVRFPPAFPSKLIVWGANTAMAKAQIEPGTSLNDAWPNVHQQSWCGEFKPRKATP